MAYNLEMVIACGYSIIDMIIMMIAVVRICIDRIVIVTIVVTTKRVTLHISLFKSLLLLL